MFCTPSLATPPTHTHKNTLECKIQEGKYFTSLFPAEYPSSKKGSSHIRGPEKYFLVSE